MSRFNNTIGKRVLQHLAALLIQAGLVIAPLSGLVSARDSQELPQAPDSPIAHDCTVLYDEYTALQIQNNHDQATDRAKAKAVASCWKRVKKAKDDTRNTSQTSIGTTVPPECDSLNPSYGPRLQALSDSGGDIQKFTDDCSSQIKAVQSDTPKKPEGQKRGIFQLNEEEAQALKDIMQRDKMMLELEGSNKLFAKLAEKLAKWAGPAAGPLDIVFKITDADIEAAQKTIEKLGPIKDEENCKTLAYLNVDSTPNARLFDKLRLVLGCGQ